MGISGPMSFPGVSLVPGLFRRGLGAGVDGYVQRWVGMCMSGGDTMGYGWQAGGTHPTGMLSCMLFSSLFAFQGIVI